MTDNHDKQRERFAEKVRSKEQRKQQSRRRGKRGIAFGMGMFGLVGWSVAIPTLLFLALGIWIDARFSPRFSWTLMLLVVGLGLGCFNAWYWVREESKRG